MRNIQPLKKQPDTLRSLNGSRNQPQQVLMLQHRIVEEVEVKAEVKEEVGEEEEVEEEEGAEVKAEAEAEVISVAEAEVKTNTLLIPPYWG